MCCAISFPTISRWLNSSIAMSCSMSRMPAFSTWNDCTQYCRAAVSSPVAPPNCSRRYVPKRASGLPKTGTEFSATLGFTGNFENTSTNYTNGLDSHLDLAASQFLNQQLFVGAVGYVYQQLTPDRGQR